MDRQQTETRLTEHNEYICSGRKSALSFSLEKRDHTTFVATNCYRPIIFNARYVSPSNCCSRASLSKPSVAPFLLLLHRFRIDFPDPLMAWPFFPFLLFSLCDSANLVWNTIFFLLFFLRARRYKRNSDYRLKIEPYQLFCKFRVVRV